MDPAFSHHSATRGRRLAVASAISALALVGAVGLGLTQSGAQAQLKADSMQTQYGRAPLSFADIVERVKPAVVSIQVSNGGAKVAANPKGGPRGRAPEAFPEPPEDSPFYEFFKRLPPEFRGQPAPRPTQAQGS